jgi:hypothetical protein
MLTLEKECHFKQGGLLMKVKLIDTIGKLLSNAVSLITRPLKEEAKLLRKINVQVQSPIKISDGKLPAHSRPKEQSKHDSQGRSHYAGSGYNAAGNVDHGKIRSNKKRR